eukprot:3554458-Rhodomonas_salina.1
MEKSHCRAAAASDSEKRKPHMWVRALCVKPLAFDPPSLVHRQIPAPGRSTRVISTRARKQWCCTVPDSA